MIFQTILLPLAAIVIIFYSHIFKFVFLKNKNLIFFRDIDFVYGIFFLTLISFFLNFFSPLKYFAYIIFLSGIIGFFILLILKKIKIDINIFSLLFLIFFFLVLSFKNDILYDSKLYHFQIIKYNYNSNLILGIVNLDFRLGFLSSWQQFLSLFGFSNYLVSHFGIIFYAFVFNIIFCKNFFKFKLSRLFLFLTLSLILFYSFLHPKFNGTIFMSIGSPEVDTICMLLLILSIYNFLNSSKNYYAIITPVILCITCKLSYIGAGIILIFLLFKKYFLYTNLNFLIIIILFSLFFILKSLATTGCALFPILQTCIDFPWSMDDKTITQINETLRNWAKDQPQRQFYSNPAMFLDWRWFDIWFKEYFLKTAIIQILLAIFLFSLVNILLRYKNYLNLIYTTRIVVVLITIFFILFIWFQAPAIRYGYGGLVILPVILFTFFFSQIKIQYVRYIFNKNFFIFLILILTIKNFQGVIYPFKRNVEDNLFIYEKNFVKKHAVYDQKLNKIDNIYVNKSNSGFCYNFKKICTTTPNILNKVTVKRYKYFLYSVYSIK